MATTYIINADDLGISKAATDSILDAFDQGVLSSASILANSREFDYAIEECKKRPGLRLSIHLNLIEGEPICPPAEIYSIVGFKGTFHRSFLSLWLRCIFTTPRRRKELKEQVKRELCAQITKVQEACGQDMPLNLDSHQHYHMIPFIFDILVELKSELNIHYIRVPHEPFFWSVKRREDLSNYLGMNLIQHLLLKWLSIRLRDKLNDVGIHTCDHFIGVLFSGKMTLDSLQTALNKITTTSHKNTTIEILFHPGHATKDEGLAWEDMPAYQRYYCSPWRKQECETLKSEDIKKILAKD